MNGQLEQARRFRGRNAREAMKLVRHAFGDNAVILETQSARGPGGKEMVVEITAHPGNVPLTPATKIASASPALAAIGRAFEVNGVAKGLADRILAGYREKAPQLQRVDAGLLARIVASQQRFVAHPAEARRVLALVGPTGVGKTTTIAKLAMIDALRGRKVGLITIDTRRIGAVEQLGSYAALLGVPLHTASTAAELAAALSRLQRFDRVYIDTAGSGPWDAERLAELSSVLDCGAAFERMLLVAASANAPDLKRVTAAFARLAVGRAGVTKIDETCHFGPCFSTLAEAGLALELFSNGPNVPEDLEHASAERALDLILRVAH